MSEECSAHRPKEQLTAAEIIDWAIGECVNNKADFEKYLPKNKVKYTAREIINACGDALTEVGVKNNLKQ